MRYTAFMGIKGDGLHSPAGTAGCYCMREFMKGYDEHLWVSSAINISHCPTLPTYLERPQHPPYIRQVPQQRNNDNIRSNNTQRNPLGVIYTQPAALKVMRSLRGDSRPRCDQGPAR